MMRLFILLCLVCIISGISGLHFTLDLRPSTSAGARTACGILVCEESNRNQPSNIITTMNVFRHSQSEFIASDKPERDILMASLTLEEPILTRESEAVKVDGRLKTGWVSLRLELFGKEDCYAEYSCEVRMLDSQEKESINTYHLLQHRGQTANQRDRSIATSAESLHVFLLLQQLDTKIALLDSKVGNVENRLEDKILSLGENVHNIERNTIDIKSKFSTLYDAGNVKLEVQDNVEKKPASLGLEARTWQQETLTDVLVIADNINNVLNSTSATVSAVHKLLTELQTWHQTDQFDCKNVTQTIEQAHNIEGLETSLNENFLQLHESLQGGFKDLKSLINSTSIEIHESIDSATSVTNTGSFHNHWSIAEILRPKNCRKGMVPLLPYAPFPYPVVSPSPNSNFSFPYLCDMFTDGGGWIVIQRRTTGNVDFYRDWVTYKEGFGSLDDDFWLGNDNIHSITSSGTYELRIDFKYKGKSAFAHYSTFSIDDENKNYALRLGDYDGTAGDSLNYHRRQQFSTFDRDNDDSSGNCAVVYSGGWWYGMCHHSNLNGKWMADVHKGLQWGGLSGSDSVSYSEMKLRKLYLAT
ncbi:tenascin-r [Plakobranchus ocellatus]|uniref:Tenascin-r n=1 Tax=Plakobranchus ocellatus TaxID=259542 RepID=A0AAV3ZJG9_9GAST|nr:tenascin-r [Plakobranchus ocellatus]